MPDAKINIRQLIFELTFNSLICKGNSLSQCSLECALDIYGVARSLLGFYNNWTLKIKIKHRYNYTDRH